MGYIMNGHNQMPPETGPDSRMPEEPPETAPPPRPAIDPRVLERLVCPETKTSLDYNAETQELISRPKRRAYPIRNGIAIMLPDEARPLDDDE